MFSPGSETMNKILLAVMYLFFLATTTLLLFCICQPLGLNEETEDKTENLVWRAHAQQCCGSVTFKVFCLLLFEALFAKIKRYKEVAKQ
jgi:hypothetical protein